MLICIDQTRDLKLRKMRHCYQFRHLFLLFGALFKLICICKFEQSPVFIIVNVGELKIDLYFISGGPAQIAGVQSSLIKNNPDGTFSLDELREKIRKNPDCHEPITSLIIVENTHNMCGGKVRDIY